MVASWWHAGNHFYQFFLLRTDRYNKKLKKYYVEIEELDEDMEEEEELEREEEREAYLLFMCYIITCLYPWFPTWFKTYRTQSFF